jgi:diguanylate cyclase (GGDEF)-like protein
MTLITLGEAFILVNDKRLTIGLLVDWITSYDDKVYYQTKIINGVEDFCKENGINLICYVLGRTNPSLELGEIRNVLSALVLNNQLDGLLAIPSALDFTGTKGNKFDLSSKPNSFPLVIIGGTYEGYNSVSMDNDLGMKSMLEHLIEVHGCRDIAFIKGREHNVEAISRYNTYKETLKVHNMAFKPELVFPGLFTFESGNEAIQYYLNNNIKFDAIAASNDNMAVGAMNELNILTGKRENFIPVTGYDDTEESKLYGITTVHQPFYEEAKLASNMLLNMINGKKIGAEEKIIPREIIRQSCGCNISKINLDITEIEKTINTPLEDFFVENRHELLHKLMSINETIELHDNNILLNEILELEGDLLDEFVSQYQAYKNLIFYWDWNKIIFWFIENKFDITILQNILSCFRNSILPYLTSRQALITGENLFREVQLQITATLKKSNPWYGHLYAIQENSLDWFGENLSLDFDWTKQMDKVYTDLPKFGINSCYISLYQDLQNPLEHSKLLLGFNETKRYDIGLNGLRYSTTNLLPDKILEELYANRFSIVVQELSQGQNQLGLIILGLDKAIDKTYSFVCHRLSMALKSSVIVQNIVKQSEDFEKQVYKRTLELSKVNERLKNEIARREVAELQLKNAMMDLSTYNKLLHHQSIIDELTGLYNRRGFMALAHEQFEQINKASNDFILFYIDIDGMKRINDSYGHEEGDAAIIAAAEILKNSFRSTDIIARLGGDEFTVIVLNSEPSEEIVFRNRLKLCCEDYNLRSNKLYEISISVGSAYSNNSSPKNLNELLKLSDQALYKEKQRKKKGTDY